MLQILKRMRRAISQDPTPSNQSSRLNTSTFVTARTKTSTLTVSQGSPQSSTHSQTQPSRTLNPKQDLSTLKVQNTSCMISSRTTASSIPDSGATEATETQSTYASSTKSGLIPDSSLFISTFTTYKSKSSVRLHQTVVKPSTYTPRTSIFIKSTTSFSEFKSYNKFSNIDHLNSVSVTIGKIDTSIGIVSTTTYSLDSQAQSSNSLSLSISHSSLQIPASVFPTNSKTIQIPQTVSTTISRASLLNKNVTHKTMVSYKTRPASSTTGLRLQNTNSYLSTPSLVASVRPTFSLFPFITSKLSVSIGSVLVTSSFQYVSSSIYSTPEPELYFFTGFVEFEGNCTIFINDKKLREDLIREFENHIKKKLADVNVTFSQNPVRCGSVIVDFCATSSSKDIEQKFKNIFQNSNITVNNQTLIYLNISTEPYIPTTTPDVITTFSTGTTTEPTKKANFTVLYITVFVIAGIVIIIIIVVITVSCQRNTSGSFSLSDGKTNYELGAVNGDSKSTINMYGSEPTMQDPSDVNENGKINEKHDKNDNSNEYQLGHLPKWELPILELDTPSADTTTKKETSDSCEGIENKGLDIEE